MQDVVSPWRSTRYLYNKKQILPQTLLTQERPACGWLDSPWDVAEPRKAVLSAPRICTMPAAKFWVWVIPLWVREFAGTYTWRCESPLGKAPSKFKEKWVPHLLNRQTIWKTFFFFFFSHYATVPKGIKFLARFTASVAHWKNTEAFEIGTYMSAPRKPHQVLSFSISFGSNTMKHEQSSDCCPSCAGLLPLMLFCVCQQLKRRAEIRHFYLIYSSQEALQPRFRNQLQLISEIQQLA